MNVVLTNVANVFSSALLMDAAAPPAPAGSGPFQAVIMVFLVLLALFFIFILPARSRDKQTQKMIDSIKINDKARRIYTIGDIDDRRQAYKFGDTKIDKILWRLYNANKWYYYNNDIGFTVDTYVNKANKL